jgi:hypothetical protein
MIILGYVALTILTYLFLGAVVSALYIKRGWRLLPWERCASYNQLELHDIATATHTIILIIWPLLIAFGLVWWAGRIIGLVPALVTRLFCRIIPRSLHDDI